MLRNNFDFSLSVNGGSVKEYEHQGQVFIEGKKGTEFSIRVKNNTHKRCLAVITVDGKSIIDGAPGNLDTGGGYIVNAYSSATIPGWRLNNDAVAKFVFSDPGESYVAQSDDDAEAMNNIGVIGCAMFYEQEFLNWGWNQSSMRSGSSVPYTSPSIWYGSHAQTSSDGEIRTTCVLDSIQNMSHVIPINGVPDSCDASYKAEASVCNLGTGFGTATNHNVSVQNFQRCAQPEAVFTLYYDTRSGLEARGVNLKATAYICPSPFPASKGRGCTPPPNWNNDSGIELNSSKIKCKLNPEIEKAKKKKATDEVKQLLAKQLKELEKLQKKIETTEVNIDISKDIEAVKKSMAKLSR